MTRKICVVTGSRAEYGLLHPLIEKLGSDPEVRLQLVVTGMHMSPEFGLTIQQIERDQIDIEKKVDILLSSDTPAGIAKSMGVALLSFGDVFEELKPDLLVVLGDRFEIFAVATAACVAKIPIAHLHGGETTEGAMDEAFRHGITKMSHIHFTSNEKHATRVKQLGENPEHVFNTGAIGVESIKRIETVKDDELSELVGFDIQEPFFMVTFHPVTLENQTAEEQFQNLWTSLEKFPNHRVIFTKANADTDGRIINLMIDDLVNTHKDRVVAFTSMGQRNYFSAVKKASVVIGNSSSGLIEVPSFKVPTVNIGDRQKGRARGASVIDCDESPQSIEVAISRALSDDFKNLCKQSKNPYEGVDTLKTMHHLVKTIDLDLIVKKHFFDV